jgi:VIT1/CCC1 family predicted Fe2+/Mn2+ transporter
MARRHRERHKRERTGWLRAAVLGSNDAIVSTAGLMMGVAATSATNQTILVAGVAGMFAGAMSMAAGEYVSVSSQADAEEADIAMEARELDEDPDAELKELAGIYASRGLDRGLAMQVARQLHAKDPLRAHLRDELGIEERQRARPLQAAWVSAASFALFAMVPILAVLISPTSLRMEILAVITLASLGALGALGGKLSGSSMLRAALRVTIGGALALAVTFGLGRALGLTL